MIWRRFGRDKHTRSGRTPEPRRCCWQRGCGRTPCPSEEASPRPRRPPQTRTGDWAVRSPGVWWGGPRPPPSRQSRHSGRSRTAESSGPSRSHGRSLQETQTRQDAGAHLQAHICRRVLHLAAARSQRTRPQGRRLCCRWRAGTRACSRSHPLPGRPPAVKKNITFLAAT